MNKTEVMKRLKAAGDDRYVQTLARHGATGKAFGVSYADLYKLQKQIGTDQPLATKLWETGNHDARILAALVADPQQMTAPMLDRWVKAANDQIARDAIAGIAVKSKLGRRCAEKWIEAKPEGIAATGWWVVAGLCELPDAFSDAELSRYLVRIRKQIGTERNRVKHSMNQTIICIGVRNGELRKKALGVAKAIGKVEVDHGDTSCKTPDAGAYIFKVVAHQRQMRKAADERATKKIAGRKAATTKPVAKQKTARKAPRRTAAAR